MNSALQALHAVDFDWTTPIDTVWRDISYDVPELQAALRKEALMQIERLFMTNTSACPLGMVLAGSGGSGKTHLLSFLRQAVLKRGAFFVLVDMTDVRDFWEITLQGYFRSLNQILPDGPTQLERLLAALVTRAATKVTAEKLKRGKPPGLINHCTTVVTALRKQHPELQQHQDVLRALVLFGSEDDHQRDLGWQWLQALGMSEQEKLLHGFNAPSAQPREVVRGISYLMSLAGPTLLALDQLDAIVAEQSLATESPEQESPQSERSKAALAIIQGIAKGLIALRDTMSRTQTVVACLEQTWSVLHQRALVTMTDRFLPPLALRPVVEASQVQRLVELRLMTAYASVGYQPPYPSHPFKPRYFSTLAGASPREVLKRCDEHRWNCLRAEEVTEIEGVPELIQQVGSGSDFSTVRARFEELCAAADPAKLIADEDEDALDHLLEAACRALIEENTLPADVDALLDVDFVGPGSYVPLHARVRVIYRAESEREKHYAVRFIQKKHHHAFQARIKAAMTASGIDHELPFRRLVLFRCGAVPTGAQTASLVGELRTRGGSFVEPGIDELKTLAALASMFSQTSETAQLRDWLRAEPIVSKLPSFRETAEYLFSDVPKRSRLPSQPETERPEKRNAGPAVPPEQGANAANANAELSDPFETRLFVGHRLVAGNPKDALYVEPENLAKHTVILAGAGSGKTVLVRRVIEEAALLGVPSIVIDGANDLSRLGDAWPDPTPLSGVDREKSSRYLSKADVVIWTPGREGGNPLMLEPLPDFAEVAMDPDDFRAALDMARSGLEPFIGTGKGADKKKGVLAGALQYFAKLGGGSLREFAGMLVELPAEANLGFEKADKIARDMGESIIAAMATNPLLRGQGEALDVGTLLTSRDSSKTRISVINLSALPDTTAQQQFVNQLATSLFTWIKKHPPKERALRGLLIVDEARDFVPSGKSVPGKDNLIRLAAQARKYGLGLLFATQAPKSIDHNVIANCSTQFFGRANSPAAIETVQEQLRDRGASGADVAKLPKGQFYVFTEGLGAPVKIATSLCLSYHPANPPDEADIVRRAKASRQRK